MERAPSGEEKRNQHNEFMRIYRLFKSNESDKMKVGSDGEKRYNELVNFQHRAIEIAKMNEKIEARKRKHSILNFIVSF